MTIKRQSGSDGPFADRYKYDSKHCTLAEGWAQVDTRQDASYYGTWTNPTRRAVFNYAEGDTYLVTADTDEEYKTILMETVNWNKECGYWIGIDAGSGELRDKFIALGLEELLH